MTLFLYRSAYIKEITNTDVVFNTTEKFAGMIAFQRHVQSKTSKYLELRIRDKKPFRMTLAKEFMSKHDARFVNYVGAKQS